MNANVREENAAREDKYLSQAPSIFVNKQDLEIAFLRLENNLEQRFNRLKTSIDHRFNKVDIELSGVKTDLKWHWWLLMTTIALSVSGLGTLLTILFKFLIK